MPKTVTAVSILLSAAVILLFLHSYIASQLYSLLLGCMVLPFAGINSNRKGSLRFAAAAALFTALAIPMPVDTFLYFAAISLLLFAAEKHCGRFNHLIVATILFAMPVTSQLLATFTFPIRLWITALCGKLFVAVKIPAVTEGNTIMFNQFSFTINDACMGLSMLTASFLISLVFLGYFQTKLRKQIPIYMLIFYLLTVFALNIAANLVRIFLLVLFFIPPQNPMHSIIGTICLAIQVLLPSWFVARATVQKYGNSTPVEARSIQKPPHPALMASLQLLLSLLLCGTAVHVAHKKQHPRTTLPPPAVKGYTTVLLPHDVTKFENDSLLIYTKRIRWFCDTEHNPMLCWTGSGYQMLHISEICTGSLQYYFGILQNSTDTLYTAWWYGNGQQRTISQFQWRRDMLMGSPSYWLINVTSSSKSTLHNHIEAAAQTFPLPHHP